ncbi:MAG: Hsp70 family protein [Bernardetiaceae bacterium]|nr:Hsp70 family protein [Bernardetiaceae bacterium]
MINFGIDLGTTNSVITKFDKGKVEVLKDTLYWQDTMPSAVAFKKSEILVGKQAKARAGTDDYFTTFKRKMGTTESFKVKALNQSVTPIELSAYVLKELKRSVTNNENIDAAIITIPASFDTIQSNATKEAGFQAGFKQVVLLAEPVAASMAYANKDKNLKDGQWLVYDLGGGTFDVALIKIQEGDMKVIDHEGDNFLGGADFDYLIVEKIIVPFLEDKYGLGDLWSELSGEKRKKDLAILVDKAEEVKKILSARTSARLEISERDRIEDNDGDFIDEEIEITRSDFEAIIKQYIESTAEMINRIVTRNKLMKTDIQFILMIGGSTYIPYVRQRIEEILQIPINCEIDPTTAVGIGAAYFAGTKKKDFSKQDAENTPKTRIQVKTNYPASSKDKEILFSAKFEGDIKGLTYQIIRDDGGYSSGTKPLQTIINAELPLLEDVFNTFTLRVYDEKGNEVITDMGTIGINSGISVGGSGNFLAHDICLETYSNQIQQSVSLLVFEKNSTLPLRKKISNEITRTIIKGSNDSLRINILEGSQEFSPSANKTIGYFEITGKMLSRDIIKGSDIDILIEMSESRDLTVSTYVTMSDQEFKEVFNPKVRHLPVKQLVAEVNNLNIRIANELQEATEEEAYETATLLKDIERQAANIQKQAIQISADDTTDKKYQLEDQKQKLTQQFEKATKGKMLRKAKTEYSEIKKSCIELTSKAGSSYDNKILMDIIEQESTFLNSEIPTKILERRNELIALMFTILDKDPNFHIERFRRLLEEGSRMHPFEQAEAFFSAGKMAIDNNDWAKLKQINNSLIGLLPDEDKNNYSDPGFGQKN